MFIKTIVFFPEPPWVLKLHLEQNALLHPDIYSGHAWSKELDSSWEPRGLRRHDLQGQRQVVRLGPAPHPAGQQRRPALFQGREEMG